MEAAAEAKAEAERLAAGSENAASRAQAGPLAHRKTAGPDRPVGRQLAPSSGGSGWKASSDKQTVRVTILSRPYVLRTADDPRQVEALANSVNDLMLAIASRAPNADSTHIAVLACLHLADRLRVWSTICHAEGARGPQVRRVRGHARPVDPASAEKRHRENAHVRFALLAAAAMFAASNYEAEIAAWRARSRGRTEGRRRLAVAGRPRSGCMRARTLSARTRTAKSCCPTAPRMPACSICSRAK